VRALTRALRRMPPDAAAAALQPELLPRLFAAFAHPAADVRKAVRAPRPARGTFTAARAAPPVPAPHAQAAGCVEDERMPGAALLRVVAAGRPCTRRGRTARLSAQGSVPRLVCRPRRSPGLHCRRLCWPEAAGLWQRAARRCSGTPRRVAAGCKGRALRGRPDAAPTLPSPCARQVVFCLVDMWGVLGEALAPHLAPLAPSQRRLVAIYVERARDRDGAAARAPG